MKTKITVKLKSGVLDPQGKAILHAAQSLGFHEVKDVRVGKSFEIEVEGASSPETKKNLSQLAEKLLANTVIENFEVEIP